MLQARAGLPAQPLGLEEALGDLALVESLSERLATGGPKNHHWVRKLVWDEEQNCIAFERTYSSDGEMHENIPA